MATKALARVSGKLEKALGCRSEGVSHSTRDAYGIAEGDREEEGKGFLAFLAWAAG
jgi:hypothetical protein